MPSLTPKTDLRTDGLAAITEGEDQLRHRVVGVVLGGAGLVTLPAAVFGLGGALVFRQLRRFGLSSSDVGPGDATRLLLLACETASSHALAASCGAAVAIATILLAITGDRWKRAVGPLSHLPIVGKAVSSAVLAQKILAASLLSETGPLDRLEQQRRFGFTLQQAEHRARVAWKPLEGVFLPACLILCALVVLFLEYATLLPIYPHSCPIGKLCM